ncbi:MAG: peptide deformylase [Bacteroidaceae bacterium]|nr:peptide deformylase [Bacteroidaceae bacterium]
MILPIYLYGQTVLRKVTEDITPEYPELKKLIEDMFETVEHAEGIGLAAPQIGLPIRLVIIDLTPLADDMPEYADFRKAYINAHIIETSEETDAMEEGCLSLPGIHEKVTRPTRIRVQYVDENFVEHDEWVDGYLARVMQHEFDHLEGKVFVDRLSPLRRQMNKNRLTNLMKGKVQCTYKTKRNVR